MSQICVVDDEPVLLTLISTILRLDGYKVTVFEDPLEAYEAIVAPDSEFSLLLTDVYMKPISGIQLAARVRAKRKTCSVLIMTGHSSVAEIINKAAGYRAAIEKPFTASELRSVIRQTLSTGNRQPSHVH
jgi:DNA-binding NtrC family response regulator